MTRESIITQLWLDDLTAIDDTRHAITNQVAALGEQLETDDGPIALTWQERATIQACLLRLLERRLSILEEHASPAPSSMHYDDSLTLTREHLEHAEALFFAIIELLNSPTHRNRAKNLARIGSQFTTSALIDIKGQLAALEAQALKKQAARANK